MARRDWSDVIGDAAAKLGPRAAFRVLQGGWQVGRALTGRRAQVRTHFLDFSMFGGDFEASADAVRRRIADVFDIEEHEPGRTMITVTALDHRKVDLLPPYLEVAVTVPVRYLGEPGDLVLEMPVTTAEARWAGAMAYGFPKVLAGIRIANEGGERACHVTAGGLHLLTLHVQPVLSERRVPLALHHFNVRDDEQIVGSGFTGTGDLERSDEPAGATLELGEHPIGVGLRALSIASTSRAHFDGPRMSAVLGKGRELGIVARPSASRRAPFIGSPA